MHDIHGDFLCRLPQLPSTVRLLLNCFPSLVRLSFNLALCPCTHQLTGVVLGNQFSQFEFEQQARNKGVPGVHPTVISSSELVMDDERLIHIKEVTQHHAVCSALLENLQSAHYSLLKAKQQVRQLPWMTGAIRQKLDESIKEQVDLLHMHCLPCCGNGKGWHIVEKHAG